MHNKLTLRIDRDLIIQAKAYAASHDRSLSELVAVYFSLLHKSEASNDEPIDELPPLTQSLRGLLKHSPLTEDDYLAYLEEKHQ